MGRMRFLCLHGRGTDAEVSTFEVRELSVREQALTISYRSSRIRQVCVLWTLASRQLLTELTSLSARIRAAKGEDLEFVFVNGPVVARPLAGLSVQRPDAHDVDNWR